jgi:histidinol-phosphate aminotransferase
MIKSLIRKHLVDIKPYSSARDLYKGAGYTFLDANENPLATVSGLSDPELCRYPDPKQTALREHLANILQIKRENLFFGVGSDEIIDLLVKLFCDPGKDEVLTISPSYGMYETVCNIHNVRIKACPLEEEDFRLNADKLLTMVTDSTKIIFLCSPNNPTGNLLDRDEVIKIAQNYAGLVVVDEAYIGFGNGDGFIQESITIKNLCVLRTFSKVYGLAGARIGYLSGNAELVEYLFKIKAPYSINKLTEKKLLEVLAKIPFYENTLTETVELRKFLSDILVQFPAVEKVFPSDANFLLIKVQDANFLCDGLAKRKIIIRDRSTQTLLKNCVRISVGSQLEITQLINAMSEIFDFQPEIPDLIGSSQGNRCAVTLRKTKETDITVEVRLDEPGTSKISTGIGFFDHMLDQIARHGNIGLKIKVNGDLGIDEHHTVEDTGIVLGETLLKALGNKAGIKRYGFYLPMDDSEASCAIDLGGRISLKFKAKFKRDFVGEFPTELVEEFFRGVASGMKSNIVIRAKGKNDHHKIEAIFKAFAKALNEASRLDERTQGFLPSTKGVL